jgi:hypothetical protein
MVSFQFMKPFIKSISHKDSAPAEFGLGNDRLFDWNTETPQNDEVSFPSLRQSIV